MCGRSVSILVLAVCMLTIPVSADLVGWWTFDDGIGTTAADSSGKAQNGTLTNGPTWDASGVYGGCLKFDGTDDRVAVTGTWTLPQYTVSVWFRQDGGTGAQRDIFSFENASGGHGIMMEIGTNGTLRFLHRAPMATTGGAATESLYSPTAPATGTWHHVALVKTATDMVMYIDGAQVATQANSGAFDGPGTVITIGDIDSRQMRPWNGAIDDVRIYNAALTAAEIAQVKSNIGNRGYSTSPRPADKANDVPRETALSWKAGEFAAVHDVYFGTSAADVAGATRAKPLGVLVAQDLDVNTIDPTGRFEFGQTYYWRVDEVNAPPSSWIFTGSVWSFTAEPVSYPVTGIKATASSIHNATTGPEKTVDGSGLDPVTDQHSTSSSDMWLSNLKGAKPAWIQYEFPIACKLDKMLVWNSNQTTESTVGFGAMEVTVDCSLDGVGWTTLGNFEFAQAPGDTTCTAGTSVDFAGLTTRFVKLTIHSNWGGFLPQYSLSEVRFLYVPVLARTPSPAPGAANLHPQVSLAWRAGREAASHDVYLGTDPNALTLAGTVATANCDVAVDLSKTYYWRVTEVNQAETPTTWAGDLWNFSTAAYINVDDFESYTNESPKRVFQTWIDGAGFSSDEFFPNGSTGNGSGSLVGYDPTLGDVMEKARIYDGSQSMPLYYDNNASPRISEAVRTLDPAKDTTDWTKHGITTLVLWFRGDPANGPAPIYVKINGTRKVYGNGAAATTTAFWKQWNLDLASVPASDLRNVKTLTIGVGDGSAGGTGTILVDAIRLYATAPQVVLPADPGTTGLVSSFNMEGGKVSDSVSGIAGTFDSAVFDASATGLGQAAVFNGTNAYVDLGADYWTKVLSKLSSCTFTMWVNYTGTGGNWQRVFDFGSGQNVNVFMTTAAGSAGIVRFAVKTDVVNSGSTGTGFVETGVNAPRALSVGWHHLAGVVNATGGASGNPVLSLYVDGVLVGGPAAGRLPKDMVLQAGTPWQMWLGRSQYTTDPYFNGSIDDLRVYNRVLSAGEIGYLAGDR